MPAYLRRTCRSLRRVPPTEDPLEVELAELLEVDVPDPAGVVPGGVVAVAGNEVHMSRSVGRRGSIADHVGIRYVRRGSLSSLGCAPRSARAERVASVFMRPPPGSKARRARSSRASVPAPANSSAAVVPAGKPSEASL